MAAQPLYDLKQRKKMCSFGSSWPGQRGQHPSPWPNFCALIILYMEFMTIIQRKSLALQVRSEPQIRFHLASQIIYGSCLLHLQLSFSHSSNFFRSVRYFCLLFSLKVPLVGVPLPQHHKFGSVSFSMLTIDASCRSSRIVEASSFSSRGTPLMRSIFFEKDFQVLAEES